MDKLSPRQKAAAFDLTRLDHIASELSDMGRIKSGNTVVEVAVLFAELRDALQQPPSAPAGDDASARHRIALFISAYSGGEFGDASNETLVNQTATGHILKLGDLRAILAAQSGVAREALEAARTAIASQPHLELVRLAVELERKTDRIHPANRHDGLAVTVKVTRTLSDLKAIIAALSTLPDDGFARVPVAPLLAVVDLIEGFPGYGTARNAMDGSRLKDQPAWVEFYNMVAAIRSIHPETAGGE